VSRLSERTQAPREIGDLLGRIARIGILLLGMLVVLQLLGWGQAALSFVAGLGIAGIVIGFALQDIVKQFAAGVLLLMLRPFRVGDQVKIGAFEGRVVEVQIRATVLKTKDGDEVVIPNADVYTTAIVNSSRYDLHRHTIVVKVPVESDLSRTQATLAQALVGVAGVVANPAPTITATDLDDQAVNLAVHFWIDERASNPDHVRSGVIAAIRRALEQAGGEARKG